MGFTLNGPCEALLGPSEDPTLANGRVSQTLLQGGLCTLIIKRAKERTTSKGMETWYQKRVRFWCPLWVPKRGPF